MSLKHKLRYRHIISTLIAAFLFLIPPALICAAEVSRYDLDVTIDIPNSSISGIAKIEIPPRREFMLVRKGTLVYKSVKLDGRLIELKDKVRTLNIITERTSELEIHYAMSFSQSNNSRNHLSGIVSNVVDSRGVSLTNTWYPDMGGPYRYSLKVTLPKDYEAVAEAEKITKTVRGDTAVFSFKFPHPLDGLNLTASNRYSVRKDKYNGIDIYTYFFNEDAHLADSYLEFTKKYLKMYEEIAGEFPYKRFSVVESFLPTGYSFPTFTLLGNTIVNLPFIVETSLGHEILHQWFGNHVYIDHQKGNWAEGLTTYLSDHLYEEQKGKGWEYRKNILADYRSYITDENEFPLKDFRGRVNFATRVIGYGKTAMVFHMLRKMTGEDAFHDALKDFVRKNPYREASWDDLRQSFEKRYGQDLSWFFDQWVNSAGIPEIRIDDLKAVRNGEDHELSFSVSQSGKAYRLLLPVTMYINDEPVTKSITLEKEKESFRFVLPDRPERIVFDEDYDVMRELTPAEFPPVISRLLGEKAPLIALSGQTDIYQGIVEKLVSDGAVKKDSADISDEEIRSSTIVVLGTDNQIIKRLFGSLAGDNAGFSISIKENPMDPRKVIAVIHARSREEADAAYGKITHYGKYTKLLFDEGRNTLKEAAETERGIVMSLKEDAPVVDLSTLRKLSGIIGDISDKGIIYVGEVHDVFAHHAVQLDIIKELYRRNQKIAVGMEMFQRPFQDTLDRYTEGTITEADFLRRSEYFKRWGFDYNLYKPILDFARDKKVPVIALNMQREIIDKVSREGLDSLSPDEKRDVPQDMDFSDSVYRERLKKIFDQHKNTEDREFDHFYQAQLLWDETMSRSIDEFFTKKPEHQIIVLAGRGHLEYGSGIPRRTFRRNDREYAIILIDSEVDNGIADYVVFPKPVEGETSPKLMVFLSGDDEQLKIKGFPEGSVSEKAGIAAGDVILSLDGEAVKTIDDVKIHLLYKKPGDTVKIEVMRKDKDEEKRLTIDVVL